MCEDFLCYCETENETFHHIFFSQLVRYFPCVPVAGEAVLTRVDGVAGAGVVLPRPQRGAGGLAATSARKQLRREGPAE